MRKIASLTICFLFVLSFSISAFARSQITPAASDVIKYTEIGFTVSGTVYATVYAEGTADELGFNYIKIIDSAENKVVASKYNSFDKGKVTYSDKVPFTAQKGKTYLAEVKYYVRIGNTSDTRTRTLQSTF